MNWTINLENDTPETIDQTTPALGWYRADLFGIAEDDQGRYMNLIFKLTGPTFQGALVELKLWNPENADTEEKSLGSARKAKVVGCRLGLINKEDLGKSKDIDWSLALNKSYVVKVVDGSYTGSKGGKVEKAEIQPWGVYPLHHQEIPPAERIKLGLPLLPGQELPTTPPANGEAPKTPGRKPRASKPAPTPPEDINVDDLVNSLNL